MTHCHLGRKDFGAATQGTPRQLRFNSIKAENRYEKSITLIHDNWISRWIYDLGVT
jgi:hypothetical protein